MAIPGGFIVMVQRYATTLPHPIQVRLPPSQEPISEPKLFGPILDIVIPIGDERHTILGKFLDAWSRLETTFTEFVGVLLQTDEITARYTQNAFSVSRLLELAAGLSTLKLGEKSKDAIVLLERVGKLNAKRNALVHGRWELHAIVFAKRGTSFIKSQFVRVLLPSDPEMEKKIHDPKNQKERARYVFRLKHIQDATDHAEALITDLEKIIPATKISATWKAQREQFLRQYVKSELQ